MEPTSGRLPGTKTEEESTGGKAMGWGCLGPCPVREQRCRPAGRELELRGGHSKGLSRFHGEPGGPSELTQVQARRPCMDWFLDVGLSGG